MKKTEKIDIVPYNPAWLQIFQQEKKPILQALGDNCLAIYHFGSTSIPQCLAKPKIDILVVVHSLSSVDSSALEKLGFEARGEVIPTGRYFSKESPRVHVHIFEKGNPLIEKNLKFRDWISTHEEDRKDYELLKMKLAQLHDDGMKYCEAKTDFINKILMKIERLIQNNKEKFNSVRKLKFPVNQYAITGSGPLGIRNLKEIKDIDIIVISKLWDELVLKYGVVEQNNIKKIVIPNLGIEIFCEYTFYSEPKGTDQPTIDERVAEADIIDGLPFESLKNTVYFKYKMGRDKDLKDIKIIEALFQMDQEERKQFQEFSLKDHKKITFCKARKSNLDLLKKWFNKPHVKEFWDNSLEMWENVESYLTGHKVLYDYWLGFCDKEPFCLVITSDASENDPDAPGSDNCFLPWIEPLGKTWTIDFMIGEEIFLGKGLSYEALNRFTEIQEGVSAFLIDPEVSNAKAIHVYEKAGFVKISNFTPKSGSFVGREHVLMKKMNVNFVSIN